MEIEKKNPGFVATLLGLNPGLALATRKSPADWQNTFIGWGNALTMQPQPADTIAVDTLKGAANGLTSAAFGAGGVLDPVYNAGAEVSDAFTMTMAEKQAKESAMALSQAEEQKALDASALAEWQNKGAELFGTPGDVSGAMLSLPPAPSNAPSLKKLQDIQDLIAGSAPVPEDIDAESPMTILLQGLAAGANSAGADAGIGDLILAAGTGGLANIKGERERVREVKDRNNKADKEFQLKRADAELAILKFKQEFATQDTTKVHNTGQGLVVEMNEVGADGKTRRVLKPFGGKTFENASKLRNVFSGLGAKDVSLLGTTKDLVPGDPLAKEQALLAELDGKGKLGTMFSAEMASPEWRDIQTDVMKRYAGQGEAAIAKATANERIAFLATVLHNDPVAQTQAFNLILDKDINDGLGGKK